jgi:hypothetical protein
MRRRQWCSRQGILNNLVALRYVHRRILLLDQEKGDEVAARETPLVIIAFCMCRILNSSTLEISANHTTSATKRPSLSEIDKAGA